MVAFGTATRWAGLGLVDGLTVGATLRGEITSLRCCLGECLDVVMRSPTTDRVCCCVVRMPIAIGLGELCSLSKGLVGTEKSMSSLARERFIRFCMPMVESRAVSMCSRRVFSACTRDPSAFSTRMRLHSFSVHFRCSSAVWKRKTR